MHRNSSWPRSFLKISPKFTWNCPGIRQDDVSQRVKMSLVPDCFSAHVIYWDSACGDCISDFSLGAGGGRSHPQQVKVHCQLRALKYSPGSSRAPSSPIAVGALLSLSLGKWQQGSPCTLKSSQISPIFTNQTLCQARIRMLHCPNRSVILSCCSQE